MDFGGASVPDGLIELDCYFILALILQGRLESADILDLMRRTFDFIATFSGEIPGATARDCGNYSFNNLPGARALAARYLAEVLTNPAPENLNYPR